MNAQHGRQRDRRPSVLTFWVIMRYVLLQLFPGNQRVHSFEKDFAANFALLGLVLGFGEG
ncbi:hypothetical protein MADE_1005615 [Alteromonas mediterranea DE]|uniref:Uncharacterized protein n=1 Tax=Alteromonas mediterranea (strain DSM 17117 / CIP 110805 / LMG 28347 / Deep ecotype) TaxID=1774373 RepID=F2G341_ALTMD|nr:hypothetical protein MADE_1005615 [Alteromonas mediterranea DE]